MEHNVAGKAVNSAKALYRRSNTNRIPSDFRNGVLSPSRWIPVPGDLPEAHQAPMPTHY